MQEKLALNVKVPRLGRNRLGVFFVRSSHTQTDGKYKVTQLSLQTKDPSLAKVLGLKFCIHLAGGGTMAGYRDFLSTYRVDLKNGQVEADGEEDHRRAVEAQKLMLQSQDKQLEAQRLELQLAEMRLRENERDRAIDRAMAKIDPDWRAKYQPLPSSEDALVGSPVSPAADQSSSVEHGQRQFIHEFAAAKPATNACHAILVPPDYRLKDEMERHIAEEKRRGKVDQTIGEKAAVFADFRALFGEEIGLNAITGDDVTARWREAEFNRPNKKRLGQTLSLPRLEKRRGYLHKFFEDVIKCKHYKWPNPMSVKMASKGEIRSRTSSYKEFTSEDLKALFGPEFTLHMSKPDWYWPPLIALFSGARLSEIVNLEVQTFDIRDGVKVFEILDGKTNSSKRTVPIHSRLLELGLWEYANALRARGATHLFPHRPVNTREKSIGEMWGKWVKKCGILETGKVFHSFRSTVITDLHNVEAGHAQIRYLTGHATEGTEGAHRGYIRGIKLINLREAVERLKHSSIDFNLLALTDPSFKTFFDAYFATINSPGHKARVQKKLNHDKANATRVQRNQRKKGG